MEYLTELKEGIQLKADVLEAWSRPAQGANLAHYDPNSAYRREWTNSTNVYGSAKCEPIKAINFDYFRIENLGGGSLCFRMAGFIDFYNKFYNLTPKAMSKIEDWHNCVFYHNNKIERDTIIRLLKEIGFDLVSTTYIKGYVRTNNFGTSLAVGSERDGWYYKLKSPREFEPEEAIAALSGKSTLVQLALDLNNLKDVRFEPTDKEAQDKLLSRLFELGYNLNGKTELWDDFLACWKVYSDKSIAGNHSNSYSDCKLMTYEQLFPKSRINTNNHINTKTDGKIIVSRKATTVTVGQRPTGRSISGRTSRIAITVGHLSNQTIRSDF